MTHKVLRRNPLFFLSTITSGRKDKLDSDKQRGIGDMHDGDGEDTAAGGDVKYAEENVDAPDETVGDRKKRTYCG